LSRVTSAGVNSDKRQASATESSLQKRWMDEAISLARASVHQDNGGPFGAVIVSEGNIIGRGWNQVARLFDPTAHAEIMAIREACRTLQRCDPAVARFISAASRARCVSRQCTGRGSIEFFTRALAPMPAQSALTTISFTKRSFEIPARAVPMIQLSRDSARSVFAHWETKPDKAPY